jgi:RNase P subunit RPR2
MKKIISTKILKLAKRIKVINSMGGKCIKCEESDIFKLCFHHINPIDKEFDINDIRNHRMSIIEREIMKCELICHNCHHELHFGDQINNRQRNNKKILLEYKNVIRCEKCGYDKYCSLHFHHLRDKKFKLKSINIILRSILDISEDISNELSKCVVLCANCHIKIHSSFEFFELNKKEILLKSTNIKELRSKIDRNVVLDMYRNGMKQSEIRKELNCSKGTISGVIKELKSNGILD